MERAGIAGAQRVQHPLHRVARVDNVLNDDDIAVFQVLVDADDFLDLARGGRALVGSKLDERDLAGNGEITHKVGSEDERTVQYGQQQRILAGHVVIDLLSHGSHALLDFTLGDKSLERLIQNFDCIHLINIYYSAKLVEIGRRTK